MRTAEGGTAMEVEDEFSLGYAECGVSLGYLERTAWQADTWILTFVGEVRHGYR